MSVFKFLWFYSYNEEIYILQIFKKLIFLTSKNFTEL